MEKNSPWQKNKLEIKVIEVYEAQIFAEKNNDYFVGFYDREMNLVTSLLPKTEFDNWPEEIKEGSPFGIILYKEKTNKKFLFFPIYKTKVGSWPPEKYWNKELLGE